MLLGRRHPIQIKYNKCNKLSFQFHHRHPCRSRAHRPITLALGVPAVPAEVPEDLAVLVGPVLHNSRQLHPAVLGVEVSSMLLAMLQRTE